MFAETPVVSIETLDPAASDVGQPNRGTIKISRTTTVGALKVDVEVGGTATPGQDYQPIRQTVVILSPFPKCWPLERLKSVVELPPPQGRACPPEGGWSCPMNV
jgi:hypothetical protein